MVESRYRVLADRSQRAIGGLSMGAAQSLAIGLHNLDPFAYIAAFSGGGHSWPNRQVYLSKYAPPLFRN
jgi:enterochelin esterase family protein